MRLREQIPTVRDISFGVHRLINLRQLELKSIDLSNLPSDQALTRSVEEANKKKMSGYVLLYKNGEMSILCITTAKIPERHPQIVKKIGSSNFCVMRSHAVV